MNESPIISKRIVRKNVMLILDERKKLYENK